MSSANPLHSPTRMWMRAQIDRLERVQRALAEPPLELVEAAQTHADTRLLLERGRTVSQALVLPLGFLCEPFDLGGTKKESAP